jgi:hypothetical protein
MYIYRSALYCDDCAERIKEDIYNEIADKLEFPTIDSWEKSLEFVEDSETYPQHELPGESDSPEHCDCMENCINAIELGDYKIGEWLENSLTMEGEEYVKQEVICAMEEGATNSVAMQVWQHEYNYIDFPDYGNCEECGKESILREDCDFLMVCEDCLEGCGGSFDGLGGCDGAGGCNGDCLP